MSALIAASRRPARVFRRVAPPAGLSLPDRASGPHSCLLLLPSPPAPDVSLTFETSPACCLPPPHIEPGYAAHQRCLCSKPTHNRPKRERHARDPLEQLRSFRLRLRVNCHGRVTVIRPGNLSPSHGCFLNSTVTVTSRACQCPVKAGVLSRRQHSLVLAERRLSGLRDPEQSTPRRRKRSYLYSDDTATVEGPRAPVVN